MDNLRFDFNKLKTTLKEIQECLCPQTGCLVQEWAHVTNSRPFSWLEHPTHSPALFSVPSPLTTHYSFRLDVKRHITFLCRGAISLGLKLPCQGRLVVTMNQCACVRDWCHTESIQIHPSWIRNNICSATANALALPSPAEKGIHKDRRVLIICALD